MSTSRTDIVSPRFKAKLGRMTPFVRLTKIAPAGACLILAFPAAAEVCDKIRPAWAPAQGSVGQFGEMYFIVTTLLTSPIGWGLAAVLVASFLFDRRWIDLVCATAALFVALAVAANWWLEDPTGINDLAVAEGCRTTPILAVALLSLLTVGMLWRGFSRR